MKNVSGKTGSCFFLFLCTFLCALCSRFGLTEEKSAAEKGLAGVGFGGTLEVAGSKCMGYIKWENRPVRASVFSKGKGAWAGIWAIKGGEKYGVCLPETGKWRVADIMDNPVAVSRKGKSIAVEITDSPVYVKNSMIAAEKLRQLLIKTRP